MLITPKAPKHVEFEAPENDFLEIYQKEASRIAKIEAAQTHKPVRQEVVSAEQTAGKAIQRYARQLEYGKYKLGRDIKSKDGQIIVRAGFWEMKIDANGEAVFVRSYEQKAGNIKAGDELVSQASFCDAYGIDIQANDYLTVVDAYDDIVEARLARSGNVHVLRASDVSENCVPRSVAASKDSKRRKAAQVVPQKFKAMIAARTGSNDEELDRAFWSEYTKRSSNQLNNYTLMEDFLNQQFGPSTGFRNTASQKVAQDKETKDYFKELWGDTDPDYAKSLTAAEKLRRKREAIRKDYATWMSRAPSKNALAHQNNVLAQLSRKYQERVADIQSVIMNRSAAQEDYNPFENGFEIIAEPNIG